MVRLLVLLGLCLALTGPAAAQQAGLRGARPAPREPPPAEAPEPPAPAPMSLAPTTPLAPRLNLQAQNADQCRATCAQDYYFCLAGDSPDACPDAWSQCRLGCGSSSAFSSLPAPAR